ncbi:uncharacterized protein VTP21DRAFT_9114 [Calcarisporiella thermophila]|uniref:uncharacterized protein n=1 Tax=Calcarisporiella thermophila TaxID=911321 RepID=UPI003743A712
MVEISAAHQSKSPGTFQSRVRGGKRSETAIGRNPEPLSNSAAKMGVAIRRLQKELADLNTDILPGISVAPVGDDMLKWQGSILGPHNSPYRGGLFRFDLHFPPEYPFRPPTIQFRTRIFHPNIDSTGSVCLPILKPDTWKPATRLRFLLLSILELLQRPNPDDALVAMAADMYRNRPATFNRIAKEYVLKYAVE